MITGQTLRDAILSGANNIANQRTRVDELNVFPVPDGDTGTNMSMTVGARPAGNWKPCPTPARWRKPARRRLPPCCAARAAIPALSPACCSAACSKALKGKTEADAADLANALQMGVDAAYKAVMKPTEGTILTVTRLAAEKAAQCTGMEIPAMWDAMMAAAREALADTPNLLPVLKKSRCGRCRRAGHPGRV